VPFSALVLMVGLAAAFYSANLTLVNRCLFRGGEAGHRWARFACILVAAVALGMALGFRGPRIDATSGALHSLSDDSSRLVAEIDRPVVIEAFVPPINKTPKDYIQTRRDLLNVLREFSSAGGDKILVRIVEAERYSDEARTAKEKFGIEPRGVVVEDEGGLREEHLLMGVACTSGPEQVVIPFLYNKLSVEYELTRSVRTVAQGARRRVGVLVTDVEIMGGFDQATFRPKDPWMIVEELKLQYDVTSVYPTSDYPENLDVLIAPMPSTLAQPEMDRLATYINSGKPVLILDDPDPLAAPGMAPTDPKGGPRNPMMMPQENEPQKGNIRSLLASIGILWNTSQLAWDVYNPHPELMEIPRTFVFVGANSGTVNAFHPTDVISAGLQEMIFLSGGMVEHTGVSDVAFTPLLLTSPVSGTVSLSSFYTNSFFGKQPNPNARYSNRPALTLACRVKQEAKEGSSRFNVIFVADLDFISNTFFQLRRTKRPSSAAGSDFNFDNITFLLNAVDSLANDDSFIRLRKRRPEHRTLTRIEEEAKSFEDAFLRQRDAAEDEATKALDEARSRLDAAVEAVRKSTDLDEMTKEIRIQTIQEVENRRFELAQVKINDERDRLVEEARGERHRNTQRIKDFYKRLGWLLSPILGVGIGLFVFFRRVQRERDSIPAERLKQGSGA
ncbi:MAG TPA: Gldg family protein, partial [Planctomycetota bacterium]|nr:Gldg family protein [Planctomycetota bacterium]